MGYQYNTVVLNHLANGTATHYSNNVLNSEGVVAFGELCELVITVTLSAGNYTTGRKYVYNPLFWASTQYNTVLPLQPEGYLLEVGGVAGALTVTVGMLGFSASSPASQNLTVSASINVADTVLTITHRFYATADLASYLGQNFLSNEPRLQRTDISSTTYSVASNSFYSRTNSYFECYIYECDSIGQPEYATGLFPDPFVRDGSNPSRKQLSRLFKGKFFDNEVGNIQAFTTTTTFDYNQLSGFKVGNYATPAIVTSQFSRNAYPFLDVNIDNNFAQIVGVSPSIQAGTIDTISFSIKKGTVAAFTMNYAAITLIDCTTANFRDLQRYDVEYKLDRASFNASDATAPPNWYNGGLSAIGTPVTFTNGLTTMVVAATIDGSKLVLGHQYRFLVHCYDSASKQVSAHISPAFIVADLEELLYADITGKIETLFDTYLGNELTVSPFERVKMSIDCDATSYPNFITDLQRVDLVSTYDNGVVVVSSYNLANGAGAVGLPTITYDDSAAPVYTFACEFRPKTSTLISAHNSTHTWNLYSKRVLSDGSINNNVASFEQRLVVSALDVARIVSFTLLDYSEWLIAIDTPINQICQDDTKVVIKVEKNGLPDASLVALFFTANPNGSIFQVEEEETQPSNTTLPITTSVYLEDVEATFVDDFAYYVIDIQSLPALPQGQYYAFGALIYDI